MGSKLSVAMDDILEARNAAREDPARFYLDVNTGRVELLTEDDLSRSKDGEESGDEEEALLAAVLEDSERYREIPRCETRQTYELMVRFAESVEDDDIRDQLEVALHGKGAFGRFRDVVFRYHDLKTRWTATKQRVDLEEAERWLASIGIDPVYELRSLEGTAATERMTPAPGRKIDLIDLLLLGAPDGKTELLHGRVLRQLSRSSESEARSAFKRLARDLCTYYGLPWRKRLVEGTSTFAIERAHLQVEGRLVHLAIEVTPATWNAFAS